MQDCFFSEHPYKDGIKFCVSHTSDADVSLWSCVFGDSDTDIKNALYAFQNDALCVSLKTNDNTISQFIAIECTISGECGIYIYALCTHPDFRGCGYMRILIELARGYFSAHGYKFFLLLPATSALVSTYKKLGFDVFIPAYATPSPECECDFFGIVGEELSLYTYSDFDGDTKELYEMSSKVFSYNVFEYCLSNLSDVTDTKYFTDKKGQKGFLIFCKERIFLSSHTHTHHIKNAGSTYAQAMPFEECSIDFSSAKVEPMPR